MESFVAVGAIQVSDVECLQLRLHARNPGGRANSQQHGYRNKRRADFAGK